MIREFFALGALLCALAVGGGVNARQWNDLYRSMLLLGCAALLFAEIASLRGVSWGLPVASALSILSFLVLVRFRNDGANEER